MKKCIAALACLFALSSCSFIASDTESLLHPPALNRQQAALNEALQEALNVSDIVYKYPQRGDFRTPFIFYDMDGDDREEAIVFYSYQNDIANTRTMVLRLDDSGAWTPFHDFTTRRDQVDFVQFAGLLTDRSACMIIGWSSASGSGRGEDSALSIHSLVGDTFVPEISAHTYIDYLVRDFDGDGVEEIVTLGLDENRVLSLSLLRAVGSRIAVGSTLPLCPEAEMFLQMLPGILWDGGQALYIDEVRSDTSVATEVVRVRGGDLVCLVGGERPDDPEEIEPRWENYTDTWRDEVVLSMDLSADGFVEVPHPVSLPGILYEAGGNPLKLTGMMQLTPAGFFAPTSAVINETEGYLVRYPERWMGRVTVQQDEESAEWRFYDIDPATEEPVTELLRVRADAGPEPPGSNYFELGQRGPRYFFGYIPLTAEEAPGISETELKSAMFQLLP